MHVILPMCYAGDGGETVISLVKTQSWMFIKMYYSLGKRVITYFGIETIHSVFMWICEFIFSPDGTYYKILCHCCRTMAIIFISHKGDRQMSQVFSHFYSHQGTMQVCNHTQRRAGFSSESSSRQHTSYEKPFFSSYNNFLVHTVNPYNGALCCRVKNQHIKAFIRRLYHWGGSKIKGFDSIFV